MKSIWSEETIEKYPTLQGEKNAQVAVIGGGMAGLLTAFFLKQKGVDAVVLEQGRIARGVTENTTAKITSQHHLIYDRLCKKLGIERAQMYANANQQAISDYQKLIDSYHINCDFEEKDAFVYETRPDTSVLQREAEAARALGIPADVVNRCELPFPVTGALRFQGQAQFHPVKFLKAIVRDLTIYENAGVKTIKKDRMTTEHGALSAEKIIFATHYPFINLPGFYFLRQHQQRSYVIAASNAAKLHGMYIDAMTSGYSFRNAGDMLLLGGEGHRTGEAGEGGRRQKLETALHGWYPQAQTQYFWSAQDCMTHDGVPYIGRFSHLKPNWFVATGFGKWGMTSSMAAARILCDLVLDEKNPCAPVFSPMRRTMGAGTKKLMVDMGVTVRSFSKRCFVSPKTMLSELRPGEGGIVTYEKGKVGAYRREDGEIFLVSTKCPHLGCELCWNPDELTWECPCHGSRFDYRGRLLDGPATSNLERY